MVLVFKSLNVIMWCHHSNEKEMSACKKIMLNSSHNKGQDYLSFVSPFDVCCHSCFSWFLWIHAVSICCPNQLYLIDSPVFILRKATGVDSKGSE